MSDAAAGAAPDPFGSTCDPDAYVARAATEAALEALESGFRGGRRVLALSGPAGIGKTLLLRVLGVRLSDAFRCLYVPYASLPWPELAQWVLGMLGESSELPDRGLLAAARVRAERGRPLLLGIDEAGGLPHPSAEGLAELVEEANGALRLLLVPVDDSRAGRVLARFPGVLEHRLHAPMSLEETGDYVAARLARSGAPAALRAVLDAALPTLHSGSGGVPAEVHRLAGELLRGNLDALPGAPARRALGALVGEEAYALEVDLYEDDEDEEEEVVRGVRRTGGESDAPAAGAAPDKPSLAWIVSVYLVMGAAAFLLLWLFGYYPPP